jgi:AraC-like DNA-binding protein
MDDEFLKIASIMGGTLGDAEVVGATETASDRRAETIFDAQNPDGPPRILRVTYDPPASLRQHVAYFWALQYPADCALAIETFANNVSGILFQHRNGGSALARPSGARPADENGIPRAFVYGKRTRPASFIARGPFELTGVVFRSQGIPALLAIDPADVNNGPVSVDDVFADSLGDQLVGAGSAAERLEVLARSLNARMNDRRPADPLVAEGVRLLREEVRTIRIPRLLTCLGVSERQLERRFKRSIGLSPHRFLRILRFQEAVRLLRNGRFDNMAVLASELNYSDQSHFIKEIEAFSGRRPTALCQTIRGAVDIPCALILAPQASVRDVDVSASPHGSTSIASHGHGEASYS